MVAAYANRLRAAAKHVAQLRGDSPIGVFNRQRIDREIAKITNPPFFEGIGLHDRIPWSNHCRLHPNIARAEARTRTVSCSPIERNADQRQVEIFGSRNV